MQEVAVPEVLYEEVIEVDERVVLRQDGCQLPRNDSKRIVTGSQDDACQAVSCSARCVVDQFLSPDD